MKQLVIHIFVIESNGRQNFVVSLAWMASKNRCDIDVVQKTYLAAKTKLKSGANHQMGQAGEER